MIFLAYATRDKIKTDFPKTTTFIRKILKKESLFHERTFNEKILFIHIPKCAGISISNEIYNGYWSHTTASQYKSEDPHHFKECFKFCITRDPIERFTSAYNYLKKNNSNTPYSKILKKYINEKNDINTFCDFFFKDKLMKNILHFQPQYKFYTEKNNIIVDKVIKIETITETIKRTPELASIKINHQNKTTRDGGNLTRNNKEKLFFFYSKDFSLGGYHLD